MDFNYEDNKLKNYNILVNSYIETINKLIDSAYSFGILPIKIMLFTNYIKNYIIENKLIALENGINYLLTNKEIILNFNINNLEDLDQDSDDNVSIKSCINNIKDSKHFESSQDDIINIMIEIKNNSKKLSEKNIDIIKQYFELLILILENIKNIFI